MKAIRCDFLIAALVMMLLLGSGCQQAEQPEATAPQTGSPQSSAAKRPAARPAGAARAPSSSSNQTAAQTRSATLAAGTALKVRTTNTLSTDSQQAGDTFIATLDTPVVVDNMEIASKGSTVEGKVVQADKGGRVKGVASLTIELSRLHTTDGQIVDIATNPVTVEARSTKGKDTAKVAIGTGVGAAIGAIAGGKKGAAIGAATGAGAGTGVVLATRGDAAEIGSETVLEFALRSPVTLTEKR